MIPMRTLTTEELMARHEIFFAGDELWRWIDSRCGMMEGSKAKTLKVQNRIVTNILAASRKAFVTIAYSAQTFGQIDKRIRDVTDFICYPLLMGDNFMCRVTVFKGSKAAIGNIMPDIRFYAEPMFAIYNTYEVVEELEQAGKTKELTRRITDNPAWIKYLRDRGFTDKRIQSYSEQVLRGIMRPPEKEEEMKREVSEP